MNKIDNFNKFISEKLGIQDEVESISNDILSNLKDKKYYKLSFKNATIECYLYPNLKGSSAFFRQDGPLQFTIKFKSLKKSHVIHEVKHLLKRLGSKWANKKTTHDKYAITNHVGSYILNEFDFLLKKDPYEVLRYTIYYSNPDEFEAYYNQFYYELKQLINPNMQKKEKREIIKSHLEKQTIFQIYNVFYKSKFDASIFFHKIEDVNLFTKTLKVKSEEFKNKNKFNSIPFSKLITNQILSIIRRLFNNDEPMDKSVHKLNSLVNRSIQKNYHKFFRLYTVFDC